MLRWSNVGNLRWPNVILLIGHPLGQRVGPTLVQRRSKCTDNVDSTLIQTADVSVSLLENTCIKQTYIQVDMFLCQAAGMIPLFSFVAVVIVKAVPFPTVR